MDRCCVHGCDPAPHDDVTFFKIPASATLARLWRKAVGARSPMGDRSLVCSRHFLREQMSECRGRMRLKAKAVPSVFHTRPEQEKKSSPLNSEESDASASDRKENKDSERSDKSGNKARSDSVPEPAPATGRRRTLRKRNHGNVNGDGVRKRNVSLTSDSDSDTDSDDRRTRHMSKKKTKRKVAKKPRLNRKSDSIKENTSEDISNGLVKEGEKEVKESSTGVVGSTARVEASNGGVEGTDGGVEGFNRGVEESNGGVEESNGGVEVSNGGVGESNGGVEESNGAVEENGDTSEAEKTDSVNDDNSGECNILVTPSIEFFYDHDDTAAEPEAVRPDIEDILTNYQIAQNNIHIGEDPEDLLASTMIKTTDKNKIASVDNKVTVEVDFANNSAVILPNESAGLTANGRAVDSTNERRAAIRSRENSSNDVSFVGEIVRPEFIEVSVDRSGSLVSPAKAECVLLLENLQVDVDPAALLAAASDDDRREEPISLVTSSDESDVILQEPKIDTVEVSSADEDDMPLTELVQQNKPKLGFKDISWGRSEYFCYHCGFTTTLSREFDRHRLTHTTSDVVYLMCESCDYTSSSPYQMNRHKRTHREEKRYKCHICMFKAKHKMSLTYHLKEHEVNKVTTKQFLCVRCGSFQSNSERKFKRHRKTCKVRLVPNSKKFVCDKCSYKTDRRNDMKRHMERRHKPELLSSETE